MSRLRALGIALALVLLVLTIVVACDEDDTEKEQDATGWGAAPLEVDGLRVLARADDEGLRLSTGEGEVSFLPGINLGGSLPGQLAGDFSSLDGAQFGGWLAQMASLGIRVVRIYDLMPPAFYDALRYYNEENPAAPIYLVQGVRLPDTTYAEGEKTLFDDRVDSSFRDQSLDVVAAVHGDLTYAQTDDQLPPVWESDVSPWVLAWILGQELDPRVVVRTDATSAPDAEPGEYVRATADATPTEQWWARQLDSVATALHDRGVSAPLSFVNGPTTDPLAHPDEPLASEDAVGIDAEHVRATDAWPGGTFASYHAYPYYPDFLRHEQGLRASASGDRPDPYAAYLTALGEHHTSMPLVVAETGVPSSIGSAHRGPLDRDQGGLDETAATTIGAELLRIAADQGASGAFLSSWTDDWSRPTWNTAPLQSSTGRHRWHDPLSAQEWFGVLRHESAFVPDSLASVSSPRGELARVTVQGDAAFLRLLVKGRGRLPSPLRLDVDTVGGPGPERRVVVDMASGTARVLVPAALDQLQTVAGSRVPVADDGSLWHLLRQLVNGPREVRGRLLPAETFDVGALVRGDWTPGSEAFDSRATWRPVAEDSSIRLRLPWSMLGLADPSVPLAFDRSGEAVAIDGLGLGIQAPGSSVDLAYRWPSWNSLPVTTRLVAGHETLAQAYQDLAP